MHQIVIPIFVPLPSIFSLSTKRPKMYNKPAVYNILHIVPDVLSTNRDVLYITAQTHQPGRAFALLSACNQPCVPSVREKASAAQNASYN